MTRKIILITGGQRSGKSGEAERLALSLAPDPVYLATAHVWDEEFRERFVRIIRKDSEGKWTLKQVGEWCQFDLLKSIKKFLT